MRWANIAAVLASVGLASAHRPGTYGDRIARQQERWQRSAREAAELAAEQEANPKTKRASEPLFLNANTTKFSVNGTNFPGLDFDIGESYAGLLPIGTAKEELFFWFFPSTNPAASKEIVLWFTGGPGCSSMSALLEENGPFTWQPGTFGPVQNPWGWNHLSNVIWIDQPIGTGYDIGIATYKDEFDVATEFRGFWKNFVDTFGLQGYEIYITGESYAGLYCPYIAGGMIDQNDTTYFNVSGMIVYDGVLSNINSDIVTVPFVDYWAGLFPFPDSVKENLHSQHETCGYADYLDKYYTFPASGYQPDRQPGLNSNMSDFAPGCTIGEIVFTEIQNLNPCFNIYEVNAQCPLPYDPLGFSAGYSFSPLGAPEVFFNRTDVKEALHVPTSVTWAMCKNGVFPFGDRSPASSLVQIPKVIEKTNNVFLMHGTLDAVLFMNVTLLTIQNMTWNGKLGFDTKPYEPLYVPYHRNPYLGTAAAMGVLGTAHEERGLTFVAVTLSGHEGPGYQPAAAYRHLEVLLGRIPNLQSTLPFTTDTSKTPQQRTPLGNGTAPL